MALAYNIFPVTIYKTRIKDNDFLKEKIVSGVEAALPELDSPEDWATDNLKTSFEGEPKGKEVLVGKNNVLLKKYYSDAISEIFDREITWEIADNIWYNYYEKGSYQELHEHIADPFQKIHFSCIHYLSYDREVHTPAEFQDPISVIRAHSLTLDKDFVGDFYIPQVEEGDLIMFPAYLQHRVLPQKVSNVPRITLSFNFRLLRYG